MRPNVTRRFTLPLIGILLAACSAAVAPSQLQPEPRDVLLMASTIGPIDAGIVGALEDEYFKKTRVLVRHAGAGTGAALDMAKRGGFDLVMVHARALEDKFVADGFGVDRRDVMYNDFAVIRINPARFPRTNATGAQAFVDWLVSDEAQLLIKSFGVDRYGDSLFFPNSDEWRKKHPG